MAKASPASTSLPASAPRTPWLGVAVLFGVLFALPIGSCATMGVVCHASSRDVLGEVPVASLGDPKAVRSDAFVTVEGRLTHLATDEFPLDERSVYVASGASVFDLAGAPNVVVYCSGSACAPLRASAAAAAPRSVAGRICDFERLFGCTEPEGFEMYRKAEAERRQLSASSLRVLLAGETAKTQGRWSIVGFVLAGFFTLLYVAAVVTVAKRRRPGAARACVDVTFVTALSGEEVRRLLQTAMASGDAFRVESEDASGFTFAQGLPDDRGRVLGCAHVSDVPRRGVVRWVARPYHPTTIVVHLEEMFTWVTTFPPELDAMCRAAFARSADQIRSALAAAGAPVAQHV